MNTDGSTVVSSPVRKPYLDWIRVIAIAMVIYNHLPAFALYQEAGPARPFYLFLSFMVQINVPLLFMVSGALLLPREESVGIVLRKRVSRFLLVIPCAYLGLYLLRMLHDLLLHGVPFAFSVPDFVAGVFSHKLVSQDAGSYWYLYAYLGYLLMLPFLRKVAAGMEKSYILLLIVLHIIIETLLPFVNLISLPGWKQLKLTPNFSIPLATERAFFYPLLGFWLDRHVNVKKLQPKTILLIILLGLCGPLLSDLAACLTTAPSDVPDLSSLPLFVFSSSACAFLVFKWFFSVAFTKLSSGRSASGISFVSSLSFGIYLFEPYMKLLLFGAYYKAASFLPTLVSSLLWIPVSMIAGGIFTWCLKKIPFLKKLL